MPKQTYYNLSKDKRDRIFNAGVLEFNYHEVNEASVNSIVRIANISKGSFYQYFENKNDFYWFVVTSILYGRLGKYEDTLRANKGDLFKTEETLFDDMLELFDDSKYRNLITNVFKTSYMELTQKFTAKGSTIYIDMYDTLMEYGFKGYNIRTKADFLIAFDMLRNNTNHTLMTMITDKLSKKEAKALYQSYLEMLGRGIIKRSWF